MCCSYNFAMFLTKNGLVYSYGKDNTEGQLGHGDRLGRSLPILINSLKE